MPKEKQVPLNDGEESKGHRQKTKKVPRSVCIREDLETPFLKLCHYCFTDFTKRINFLINQDIEALKKTNPEIFEHGRK